MAKVAPSPPIVCDYVYAVVVLDFRGHAAITYWARSQHYGVPLYLLDWAQGQFVPNTWVEVEAELSTWGVLCGARYGAAGTFVEDRALAQQGQWRGHNVQLIPDWLLRPAEWSALTITAMQYAAGDVKVCAGPLVDRPMPGLYHDGGADRPEEPSRASFVLGVVLGLDEGSARKPRADPTPVKVLA